MWFIQCHHSISCVFFKYWRFVHVMLVTLCSNTTRLQKNCQKQRCKNIEIYLCIWTGGELETIFKSQTTIFLNFDRSATENYFLNYCFCQIVRAGAGCIGPEDLNQVSKLKFLNKTITDGGSTAPQNC